MKAGKLGISTQKCPPALAAIQRTIPIGAVMLDHPETGAPNAIRHASTFRVPAGKPCPWHNACSKHFYMRTRAVRILMHIYGIPHLLLDFGRRQKNNFDAYLRCGRTFCQIVETT